MRSWLINFIFLISEDVKASDMSLSMSMLTSLRGSDVDNLAWELILGKNKVSFSKLSGLDWITQSSTFLLLEIFLRVIFFLRLGLAFRGHNRFINFLILNNFIMAPEENM
jgi:hypothetical protein